VAWLDEQLELVLSRLAVLGEHNGGRSAETPMPIHLGAAAARYELREALTNATKQINTERTYPGHTLPLLAGWLLAHLDRIATHTAAAKIYGDIHSAIRFAAKMIDLPANRTTFPVGPCPELGCQGEIRAYIPAQPERPARMECSVCETRWEPHQWLRAGRRILARKGEAIGYVDVQVAASSLGVTARTVQNWVKAGRLANHGDERRIMVDLAEVERVVAA
jgi:hypothetical protein